MTGYAISRRTQRALKLVWWERLGILAGAFCGAMIGAKLPFLFTDWQSLLSGAAWFQNGKTIVCGLAGGYLGVEIAKWSLDIRTRTGDSFAVPVAVTVGIGRFGCFHAQCCHGTPTTLPWGVVFTSVDAQPRHPHRSTRLCFIWRPPSLWGSRNPRSLSRTPDQVVYHRLFGVPIRNGVDPSRNKIPGRLNRLSMVVLGVDRAVRVSLDSRCEKRASLQLNAF